LGKIVLLYKQQANEYRARARKCFVQALEKDSDEDFAAMLSDEEAMSRIDLFAHLYSKPAMIVSSTRQQADANVQELQSSLEDRLMQLNKSLPQGFKTSDERMRDINRGLNRLGLSFYSNADPAPTTSVTSSMQLSQSTIKSESEQVDDLIAQAKDEATLMGDPVAVTDHASAASSSSNTASGDAVISYFESMLAAADANDETDDLTPDVVEEIRDCVAEVQASLAELMALLSESIQSNDGDDDDSTVLLDRTTAKQMLQQAGIGLVQATKHILAKRE
jgi:hypothetical protein